jgi:hypothetical protein
MPENNNETYTIWIHSDDSENALPGGTYTWEEALEEKARLFRENHVHSVSISRTGTTYGMRYYNFDAIDRQHQFRHDW